METINSKLLNWASILDDKTREQARHVPLPFIYPHLALMPDAHLGKGATVGSVIPTLRRHHSGGRGRGHRLRHDRRPDPVLAEGPARRTGSGCARRSSGPSRCPPAHNNRKVAGHGRAADRRAGEAGSQGRLRPGPVRRRSGELQLGSLGSGNHFIEVCADETDAVWLFLHSGSRGVGNRIAQHHIGVAQARDEAKWITLPDPDLAYLVEGTAEFDQYIEELRWAQHFALLNREEMMDRVIGQFGDWVGRPVAGARADQLPPQLHPAGEALRQVRVGVPQGGDQGRGRATRADSRVHGHGVVRGGGLGNPVSLNSSPHGAGREYSRTAARKAFTLDELRTAMEGIEYRDTEAFIDEIPAAYKPIDQVMARRGGPGRDPAHPAPARQRQRRLSRASKHRTMVPAVRFGGRVRDSS